MKKRIAILLLLCLLTGLCACAAPRDTTTVRVGALKGPTAMGMAKLLTDGKYDYQLAGAVDELTPQFLQGELDILAAPANLGSVLYHKTQGEVQMLAVNTLGVLYLVERGQTVTDWESLRGRTILASGKGATPEYCLNYLLRAHGLTPEQDVQVQYYSEHAECVAQLAAKPDAIAMLPQPFVTAALAKLPDLRIAVDMNAAWEAEQEAGKMLTGVLLVRRSFAREHPEAVRAFLEDYRASTDYVNQNPADAARLIGELGIVDAAVAEKAIPYCNIVCITGAEMQEAVTGYLTVLEAAAPESIGGTAAGEDLFCEIF